MKEKKKKEKKRKGKIKKHFFHLYFFRYFPNTTRFTQNHKKITKKVDPCQTDVILFCNCTN